MDTITVRTNGPASASAGRNAGAPNNLGRGGKLKKNKLKIAAIAAGALLLLFMLLGGWVLYRSSASAHIDSSKYQAVFFTNGQVYFGKLQGLSGSFFKLTDIYYLQATKSEKDDSKNPQETSNQGSDVQLVKLGNEVHGPVDEMIISRDQILFFENLKQDGKVTDSIGKYQQSQKQ